MRTLRHGLWRGGPSDRRRVSHRGMNGELPQASPGVATVPSGPEAWSAPRDSRAESASGAAPARGIPAWAATQVCWLLRNQIQDCGSLRCHHAVSHHRVQQCIADVQQGREHHRTLSVSSRTFTVPPRIRLTFSRGEDPGEHRMKEGSGRGRTPLLSRLSFRLSSVRMAEIPPLRAPKGSDEPGSSAADAHCRRLSAA